MRGKSGTTGGTHTTERVDGRGSNSHWSERNKAQHSAAQHSKGEQTRGGLCLLECLAHGPLCCARVCL
jgi:hypothetical protein